jgi:SHS2 domain-containing protein
MAYKYLEDVGTADIAFEATGRDLSGLFTSAADATMNVMIENLDTIEPREMRRIELKNDAIDMLLFDFLQELIYFKDAERLLLRVREMRIEEREGSYSLKATTAGEPLDAARHQQRADVKAVTLHDFRVEKTEGGWRAAAILDI